VSFIIILVSVLLGFERNILVYFLPILLVNYFLLDYSNRMMLFSYLLIPTCYIFVEFSFDLSPFIMNKISNEAIKVEWATNIIFSLLMTSVFIHFILRDALENEKTLNASIEKGNNQNKELTKINEELDRFVYSVSHDLKSPVATMKGLANLTKNETDFETVKKYNLLQEKSLLKLDLYIKDILSYYASNRLKLQVEKIDFEVVIAATIERYEFEIASNHIKVISDIQLSDDFYSDNYHLKMILNNILSNTVKYYDANKAEKRIVINVQQHTNLIIITIWDNGQGIDKNQLPEIFNMFHRSEITSASSGLGMYIVKECVEKLEGKIEIESRKRIFTEIKISIPTLRFRRAD